VPCVKRIETAAKMHGVETAVWNAEDNLLQIKYNPKKFNWRQSRKILLKLVMM
jgi:hypothetical protein